MTESTVRSIEICIGIPTLGRSPSLSKLLLDLKTQIDANQDHSHTSVTVIVVDNQPNPKTRNLVNSFCTFQYYEEPIQGYASSRNRILEIARDHEFLIMIDDDMILSPNWFSGVIESIESKKAHIYASNVFTNNLSEIPIHLRKFFIRPDRKIGQTNPNFGTGNVILDMSFVKRHDLSFDMNFNNSGGEDFDFFSRMTKAGARSRWESNFPVYEDHKDKKLTLSSVMLRESRAARNYERINSNKSIFYTIILFIRMIEIAIFDIQAFKLCINQNGNINLKIKIFLTHKIVNFCKMCMRLSGNIESKLSNHV